MPIFALAPPIVVMDASGTAATRTSLAIVIWSVITIEICGVACTVPPSSFVGVGAVPSVFVVVAILCAERKSVHFPKVIADIATRHFADTQFVLAIFISDCEAYPFAVPGISVGFFEVDAQFVVASRRESIDDVVAEPIVLLVAKSFLVFSPGLEEVHGVTCALLEYNPTVIAGDIGLSAGPRDCNRG